MADLVGQQLGNYHLLRVLGQGMFAVVYLGEHQYLERPAAVKVLHVQMDPKAHEAFLREARTIALLDHPHIVRVHDFGIEDQTPYLVMEYTSNGTLRMRHPKGTRLSYEQIVTYVKQIASALDYAHEHHVIHRDIKPENVLLNAKEDIVLSDFGIAVVQSTLASLSEQKMAGTPLYMAPEQIQREPCLASDQYALGVMVYEWLCGEPPFRGPLYEILSQHLHKPPPSLCARMKELPPAVEDAVLGALAKDPQDRFPTVQDFATVLEEAFFTTQPLTLSGSVEQKAPDETTLSLAPMHPAVTPVPSEQDQGDDVTEPRLKAVRPTKEQQEQVPSISPQPAIYRQPVSQQHAPFSVMCICAPPDCWHLDRWDAHLRPLEQAGYLTVWSELHLLAGDDRLQQLNDHLEQADLLVLLLSVDFFASQECMALMAHALERHRSGNARIVPLLLRPVAWQESPLASLSCIPSNHRPVTEWTHLDTAFDVCVREVRPIIGRPITSTLDSGALRTDRLSRDGYSPGEQETRLVLEDHSQRGHYHTQNQNRQTLLRKVRSFWIEGVLSHSLHGVVLLALGLETQPDAVANPWHLVFQQPETGPRPQPAGTRITQVYNEAGGELLILGAPGAGKTTLLLELARDLLELAERNEQHPVPVVFNLSSWAMKRQRLTNWLAEELNTKYQVPPKLARALVGSDQILPLLDGLDEVAAKERTACIEAINTYRQEHGLLPLVVCSRSADYLAQTARVQLSSAVMVQPLSQKQVEVYLRSAGPQVQALSAAVHHDADLQKLSTTPLMLSILTLAYQGIPLDEIAPLGTLPDKQKQVFTTYVQRMLTRRGSSTRYTQQQTIHWLSWLAKQLVQRRQTEFSLERIQPDWLPDGRVRWLYSLVVMLVVGSIFGLLFGLALGPVFGPVLVLRYGLVMGLILTLIYVIAYGLLFGLLYRLDDWLLGGLVIGLIGDLAIKLVAGSKVERGSVKAWSWSWTKMRKGLAIGLVVGVMYGFMVSSTGWVSSLIAGLLAWLVYALASGLVASKDAEIRPAEVLSWSWVKMRWGLVVGLVYGAIVGLGVGLLLSRPVVGLIVGSLGILIYGLIKGLSGETLPRNARTKPNQGIWRSLYNGTWIALITGLFTGLIVGLVTEPVLGLFYGLYFGLAMGLQHGGIAVIKHGVLRFFLWRAKFIPWNYIRFLDYTTECILLRRVGGSYIFIHRLLLEHCTTVSIMPEQDEVPVHK